MSKSLKKNKQNKVIYSIINITENTKEKDCISADKKNEKKYRETIEKLGVTSKEWENTGVMLNMEIPPPPQPSNYEKLLEYRRTHVLRPAIIQSEATIYLYERGYQMGKDFQAYQAIEIVNKLKEYELENSLPQITESKHQQKVRTENYLENCEVDLDVLNFSNQIEKKRHSINIPTQQITPKPITKRFGSFSYSGKKSKSKNNPKFKMEPDKSLVKDIAHRIDCKIEEGKNKPHPNYNKTLRKKPETNKLLTYSKPSKEVFNQYQRTQTFNHFGVMPSAPPAPSAPPNYEQNFMASSKNNSNSNSSVDSLFDADEIKQFEKKLSPSQENYHYLHQSQQQIPQQKPQQYNGIYPPLPNNPYAPPNHQYYPQSLSQQHQQQHHMQGESDGDDVCSV